MTHLKLIHSQDKNAKALGKQLAQSDQSISDGAVAKLSGVSIEEIAEWEEHSPVLDVVEVALPLATAVANSQRISANALSRTDPSEHHIAALKAIAEVMQQGAFDYNYNLGILNRESREE